MAQHPTSHRPPRSPSPPGEAFYRRPSGPGAAPPPPHDHAPHDHAPHDHAPHDHDHAPHDHAPHDHAPHDHAPHDHDHAPHDHDHDHAPPDHGHDHARPAAQSAQHADHHHASPAPHHHRPEGDVRHEHGDFRRDLSNLAFTDEKRVIDAIVSLVAQRVDEIVQRRVEEIVARHLGGRGPGGNGGRR
jgi:hypothetical protein